MVLLAIVVTLAAGIPAVLAVDRTARGPLLAGLAYLYGSGIVYFTLLALTLLHVRWWMAAAVGALALVTIALVAVVAMRRRRARGETTIPLRRPAIRLTPLDLVSAFLIAAYARFALIARPWEWDFWAIWGWKGRQFLEAGGVAWKLLQQPWNDFAHPDYPLLAPLNYAFTAILHGSWDDRWMGAHSIAFGVAFWLIVRTLAEEETGRWLGSAVAMAAASFVATHYVGLAEGPLIACGGAGLLMLRRGLLRDDAIAFRHGAILMGLAASSKNEGEALLAAAVGALVLSGTFRRVVRLWPAVAIVAPWLVLRALYHLATDLATGPVSARAAARLAQPMVLWAALAERFGDGWLWLAIVVAFAVAPGRRRERFLAAAVAIQFVFYVGSYVVTPNDLFWHIATSWLRLTRQVLVPAMFAAAMLLARTFFRGDDSPHAEARPDL